MSNSNPRTRTAVHHSRQVLGEQCFPKDMANLLDLPTELLLQIVRDVQLKPLDLYSLAILSRRLNSIAMPLFLASRSIHDAQKQVITLVFDDDSRPHARHYVSNRRFLHAHPNRQKDPIVELGAAAGLVVAFDLTSIRTLECTFPQSFTDISALQRHLDRLATLLSRLTSIDSLTIHFEGDHKRRHTNLNPLSAVPVPVADVMNRIFDSIARAGCRKLTLYNKSLHAKNQPEFETEVPFEQTDSLIRAVMAAAKEREEQQEAERVVQKKAIFSIAQAKRGLRRIKSHLFDSSNSPDPPVPPPKEMDKLYPFYRPSSTPSSSRLGSLHIQTPFALLPRCLPAIRNLIHASKNTLTSLTLSHIIFHRELFAACLSALCFDEKNAITHLTIVHCHIISTHSFLDLLFCFQDRLEYLEFDRDAAAFIDSTHYRQEDVLHFHELATLKAPLDWVVYFLKAERQNASDDGHITIAPSLPNLSSLTIYCRSLVATYFTYEAYYPLVNPILEKLHTRWVGSSQYALHPRVDVTLDVHVDKSKSWQMEIDRAAFNLIVPYASSSGRSRDSRQARLAASLDPASATLAAFATHRRAPEQWMLVTGLDVSPTLPPADAAGATLLTQWVTTLFPGVRQVRLQPPYIPQFLPPAEYKRTQKEFVVRAGRLLRNALCETRIDKELPLPAWRALNVGQWTVPLDD
ncbi:unnamed protein product [Cyclocybe aegerita]|uniref:F-box domain-containing protein n=1 Tax=Cyclocybe aegerita TaxID=1973307 RepID=A0A8S0WK91_CYCAE|nr:unnamed protein product [Cyclocybe aegerita]